MLVKVHLNSSIESFLCVCFSCVNSVFSISHFFSCTCTSHSIVRFFSPQSVYYFLFHLFDFLSFPWDYLCWVNCWREWRKGPMRLKYGKLHLCWHNGLSRSLPIHSFVPSIRVKRFSIVIWIVELFYFCIENTEAPPFHKVYTLSIHHKNTSIQDTLFFPSNNLQ